MRREQKCQELDKSPRENRAPEHCLDTTSAAWNRKHMLRHVNNRNLHIDWHSRMKLESILLCSIQSATIEQILSVVQTLTFMVHVYVPGCRREDPS